MHSGPFGDLREFQFDGRGATEDRHRHLDARLFEIEFLDQGEKTVKNIAQPVHVYFINMAEAVHSTPAQSAAGAQPSVAASMAVATPDKT